MHHAGGLRLIVSIYWIAETGSWAVLIAEESVTSFGIPRHLAIKRSGRCLVSFISITPIATFEGRLNTGPGEGYTGRDFQPLCLFSDVAARHGSRLLRGVQSASKLDLGGKEGT